MEAGKTRSQPERPQRTKRMANERAGGRGQVSLTGFTAAAVDGTLASQPACQFEQPAGGLSSPLIDRQLTIE